MDEHQDPGDIQEAFIARATLHHQSTDSHELLHPFKNHLSTFALAPFTRSYHGRRRLRPCRGLVEAGLPEISICKMRDEL